MGYFPHNNPHRLLCTSRAPAPLKAVMCGRSLPWLLLHIQAKM